MIGSPNQSQRDSWTSQRKFEDEETSIREDENQRNRRGQSMEQKISHAENEAAKILAQISNATTKDEIKKLVRAYVKARYFLEEEDLALDSFNALGQMSIARATGMDIAEVMSGDLHARCDAASPALTKKILLMISLNRELGLGVSPEESADITTLSLLEERIAQTVLKNIN